MGFIHSLVPFQHHSFAFGVIFYTKDVFLPSNVYLNLLFYSNNLFLNNILFHVMLTVRKVKLGILLFHVRLNRVF